MTQATCYKTVRKPTWTKVNMKYNHKYNFRVFIIFISALLFWRSDKSLLNLADLESIDSLQYRQNGSLEIRGQVRATMCCWCKFSYATKTLRKARNNPSRGIWEPFCLRARIIVFSRKWNPPLISSWTLSGPVWVQVRRTKFFPLFFQNSLKYFHAGSLI